MNHHKDLTIKVAWGVNDFVSIFSLPQYRTDAPCVGGAAVPLPATVLTDGFLTASNNAVVVGNNRQHDLRNHSTYLIYERCWRACVPL